MLLLLCCPKFANLCLQLLSVVFAKLLTVFSPWPLAASCSLVNSIWSEVQGSSSPSNMFMTSTEVAMEVNADQFDIVNKLGRNAKVQTRFIALLFKKIQKRQTKQTHQILLLANLEIPISPCLALLLLIVILSLLHPPGAAVASSKLTSTAIWAA